jgi:hypothetical protein
MKDKVSFASLFFASLLLFPLPALAYSSWSWFTTMKPIYILPVAVVAASIIEIFIIAKYNDIKRIRIVVAVVSLANILSFAAPYLIGALVDGAGFTFGEMIDEGPSYMINAFYCILTLLVEMPAVYFLLRRFVANRKKLILTILIANAVTTALIAICERLLCVGGYLF